MPRPRLGLFYKTADPEFESHCLLKERNLTMAASSGLTQQSSLYSWSLDDFHNEPCANESNYCKNNGNRKDGMGSMNMEELLRNIYSSEEGEKTTGNDGGGGGGGAPLNLVVAPTRQNSPTPPHFNKSVDEIWKEITASAPSATVTASNSKNNEATPPQRELTLGEMTLEDFLAKAGFVREDNSNSGGVVTNLAAGTENWQNFQFNARPLGMQKQIQRPPQPVVFRKARVPALQSTSTGGSALEASSVVEASIESGATSSFAPFGNGVSLYRGKKRCGEPLEDKAVDQRQRRMIKNRESAARSRERKQAYTVELETQLTQLKEENAQLTKQQDEEKKRRFKQLMETLIPVEEMRKPPQVLRRTRTALW